VSWQRDLLKDLWIPLDPPLESLDAEDAFISRLNADGTVAWRTQLGGPENQRGTAVAVDPAGAIIVAGTMWGSIELDTGTVQAMDYGSDVFVARVARW
jgi:hypothetical protein